MRARDLQREATFAIGDSREILRPRRTSARSGWLPTALENDPTLREALGAYGNVRIAEAAHGGGVYEAVITTLAERR